MSIKFLLKIFPFTLLIYNISHNLEASNTTAKLNDKKSMEFDNILKNNLNSNKSKEKNINNAVDVSASDSIETEANSYTNINTKDFESNKTKNYNNTKDTDINMKDSDSNKSEKHSNIENSYNNKDENEEEDSDDDESEAGTAKDTEQGEENDSEEDSEDDDTEQSEENDKDPEQSEEDDDESEAGTAEDTEQGEEDPEQSEEDDEEDDKEENDSEEDDNEEEEEDLYANQDPFEKWNRKVHAFNDKMSNILDKFSKNKDNSKQSSISKGIGNFSHNFFELPRVINYGLQGNIKNMSNTIARLIINTAFGFFGATDVAEKLGFPKNRTYFGDTLKKWGMKPGPYVVLPILGPTSLRGAVGQAFESLVPQRAAIVPLSNIKTSTQNTIFYAIYCSSLLATRSAYGDMIKQVSAMSKDTYKTFRNITMSMESN